MFYVSDRITRTSIVLYEKEDITLLSIRSIFPRRILYVDTLRFLYTVIQIVHPPIFTLGRNILQTKSNSLPEVRTIYR